MYIKILIIINAYFVFPFYAGQDCIVHTPLDEYLKSHQKKPNISLGTEHVTEDEYYSFYKQSKYYQSLDITDTIDRHRMPGDLVTHQDSYVVNVREEMHPDLEGAIDDTLIQNYLLQLGMGKIYLIWEEFLPIGAYQENESQAKTFVNFVYELLKNGGYFAFLTGTEKTLENLLQQELSDLKLKYHVAKQEYPIQEKTFEEYYNKKRTRYITFYNTVKDVFGAENIKKYPFDHKLYYIRQYCIDHDLMPTQPEPDGTWDYSKIESIQEPLQFTVKTEETHPAFKEKENYDRFETINLPSITPLLEFNNRMYEVSKIDPILAKYPKDIVITRKVEKDIPLPQEIDDPEEEKEEMPVIPIIHQEKIKKRNFSQITSKQQKTTRTQKTTLSFTQRVLGFIGISSFLSLIAILIYRFKYRR